MKIVRPNHKIMIPKNPYKHIESIGRTCYKSEDAITETSAEPFVSRLFNSGHHAMIEHFRFIVEVTRYEYDALMNCPEHNKYITFTDDNRYVISASARGINDMFLAIYRSNNEREQIAAGFLANIASVIVDYYKCPAIFCKEILSAWSPNGDDYEGIFIIEYFKELSYIEYNMHAWYSIHFTCDRGVTHEMVRHRDASFAQESTRYCNYSNGKYDGEITVIEPMFWEENSPEYNMWYIGCKNSEDAYMALMKSGASPQEARSVLPNSLKTEIIITAQVYEWLHIFDLRVLGKTGAPHPQIKEVMMPAYTEMVACEYLQ